MVKAAKWGLNLEKIHDLQARLDRHKTLLNLTISANVMFYPYVDEK